jgi:hypothetical protein
MSRQKPLTEASALSGPAYDCGGTQKSMPEVASVPVNVTVSEWLYQPFRSGLREGVAVTPGAVLSILIVMATVVSPPSLRA